jgi:DNA-binding Xre family transcriptional regulator
MKGISKVIKLALIKREMNQTELSEKLKMSMQNLNNKLRRESFTDDEMKKIAKALNATFFEERAWLKLNDTGEEIR